MPFVFCEVCDYLGRGRTLKEQILDVIDHEEKMHRRYEDREWLLEKDLEEMYEPRKEKGNDKA